MLYNNKKVKRTQLELDQSKVFGAETSDSVDPSGEARKTLAFTGTTTKQTNVNLSCEGLLNSKKKRKTKNEKHEKNEK